MDKVRAHYRSSRWTGRYRPGEGPPDLTPYRRRSARWWLGLTLLLAIGVAVAQLFAPDDYDLRLAALFVIGLSGASSLSPYASHPFFRGKSSWSEGESAAVARATAHAYGLFTALVLLAFGWCAISARFGWPSPHRTSDWLVWAAALFSIASDLPTLIAELTIPFPPPD